MILCSLAGRFDYCKGLDMQDGSAGGTLLAVDDDHVILELMTALLEREGYTVLNAENGLDAWRILETSHMGIDALLLDRNMPVMDGMELLKKIKAHEQMSRLPVIMVTAAIKQNEVAEGIVAGAFYYLAKPFDNRALVTIVRAAVSDRRSLESLRGEVRRYKKMLKLVRESRFEYRTLAEAHDLAVFLANFYPDPESVVLGLSELLVNAVEHGNLGVDYQRKTELINEEKWEEEIRRLQSLSENSKKWVEIEYRRTDEEIAITIKDEGDGFDWRTYMELNAERITDSHGRGIAMARMISFDEMEFLGSGNEVLCKVFLTDNAEVPA